MDIIFIIRRLGGRFPSTLSFFFFSQGLFFLAALRFCIGRIRCSARRALFFESSSRLKRRVMNFFFGYCSLKGKEGREGILDVRKALVGF